MAEPPFDLRAARAAYWRFHWGAPPDREFRVRAPLCSRGVVLAQLGHLVGLELAGGGELRPGRQRIHLATDADGRGLYLVARSGVQLADDAPTGVIAAVLYRTNKNEDRAYVWRHPFEGRRPRLDRDSQGWPVIRRAGSRYRVTWRGIVG